jgi:hypothetical protein
MKETTRWTHPTFELLRMDAEIGSYQDDSDPVRDAPAFVVDQEESGQA